MSRLARATVVALGAYVAAVAVVAVEVQLARGGERLTDEPLALDGRIGGGDGVALRVVWLGDSTAAGVGASTADAAVPRAVAAGLGRPVDLHVLAVSGARVADVVAEQVGGVATLRPDLVLVSVGANDVTHLTGAGRFRSTYEQVLDALPGSARVVLLGVPDMGSIPRFAQPLRAIAGARGARLDSVVHDLAAARGVGYVDIAGVTGAAFRADPDANYAADRFHPSDAGYRRWADAVLAVLG